MLNRLCWTGLFNSKLANTSLDWANKLLYKFDLSKLVEIVWLGQFFFDNGKFILKSKIVFHHKSFHTGMLKFVTYIFLLIIYPSHLWIISK